MTLAGAIIGHLVGDYLLQTDEMAKEKKQDSFICGIHCFIWTICVMMMGNMPAQTAPLLFISHYVQDRTQIVRWYMNKIGQKEFLEGPCAPWSAIVVDNVFHLLAIYLIGIFCV